MSSTGQREALERLIKERREDYAGLSRLIGRNSAYIQQFIKRGVPRKLDEKDRQLLARYFGVEESVLGGPSSPAEDKSNRFFPVPQLDVGASAGPGSVVSTETLAAHIAFDPKWLRQLARGLASDLSLIRVRGDSMSPTLVEGDDILVDRGDAATNLRDGIYVLRLDDSLMVKRLARSPSGRAVAIKSDNHAYPSWSDIDLVQIDIIGRVVWTGRRLR